MHQSSISSPQIQMNFPWSLLRSALPPLGEGGRDGSDMCHQDYNLVGRSSKIVTQLRAVAHFSHAPASGESRIIEGEQKHLMKYVSRWLDQTILAAHRALYITLDMLPQMPEWRLVREVMFMCVDLAIAKMTLLRQMIQTSVLLHRVHGGNTGGCGPGRVEHS